LDIDYGILNKDISILEDYVHSEEVNKKWVALRILENNKYDLLILIERINNKIHLVICI